MRRLRTHFPPLLLLLATAVAGCDDPGLRPAEPFRSPHSVVGEVTHVQGDPPTGVRLRDVFTGQVDGFLETLVVDIHPEGEVYIRDRELRLLRVPPTFLEVGARIQAFHGGEITDTDPPRVTARRIDILPEPGGASLGLRP